MTLKEALTAYKASPKPNFKPEYGAVSGRTIATLVKSGQADRALKTGDRAPVFTLLDQDGESFSSVDMLEKGPLVLTFYRGVWCPFCNIELKALQAALGDIESRGALLAAISQQTTTNNRKSRRENELTFPILSDKGGDVGAAFGLRWTVPDEMREVHKQLGGPLPVFNGEDSWTLPIPARYVIGRDGVIAYSEVNPDYTTRPEPVDLLPVLDRL
ncbi:peroxiredoxin-like family protein [Caballeronia sordidicola]|uniref:thioredoxin-dependent peroxiredoxin n=1 Tax=Caballeronia sordidicola TaxID=196367 RepID=A0A226XAB2_CABSO|nr:peroxiredoxin-like family protein [Caballeronia sordidicola]OXC80432.1 Peroxiredoxin [Caballeronia sordidicola]